MKTAAQTIAVISALTTVLPMLRVRWWWVRIFDFPRLQIAGLAGIGLAAAVAGRATPMVKGALASCLAYQAAAMLPYTRLWPRQVQDARMNDSRRQIRLLLANVLMTNRNAARFREMAVAAQPDIIFAVETDRWWLEQLQDLRKTYPYTVFCPLENTYGMLLFSRLELIDPQVQYVVEPDIPSIHTRCRLRSGDEIDLRLLHPRPPFPTESSASAPRDAELLLVGDEVKKSKLPRIVAGDLNDVAWSRTTKVFQKVSGLLDPRIGRGFFNTFHAMYPVLRFSLDHLFHSNEFRVRDIRRMPKFGSDHFPVLITLSYEPQAAAEQPEPEPAPEDHAEKHEAVRDAKES